jgi:hypothetical protein
VSDKLTRIRELVRTIDESEAELSELIGEVPKAKRGRPRKEKGATEAAPGNAAQSG